MEEPTPNYAWCFSHGRMHTFWPDREPWCTALWVRVAGITEDEAEAAKRERFGDARFMHDLPVEEQVVIHKREG